MNEELIKQCAREWRSVSDMSPDRLSFSESAAFKAIRLYHVRHVTPLVEAVRDFNEALFQQGLVSKFSAITGDAHVALHEALAPLDAGTPQPSPDVAPLEQENAELRALVKDLTAQAKADGERIGRLEASVAPLVEAVRDFKEHGVIGAPDSIERMYNALASFQQGAALSALAEADGPYIGEAK